MRIWMAPKMMAHFQYLSKQSVELPLASHTEVATVLQERLAVRAG